MNDKFMILIVSFVDLFLKSIFMKLDYGAIGTSDLEKMEGYYMKYSGLTVIVNIQMLLRDSLFIFLSLEKGKG